MTGLTYVLVHGAWHGSWCWKKVAQHLRDLDHKVIVPNLPGHYDNPYDFRHIRLSTYVNHIEEILGQCEGPVILVGHSMAGLVISQVAENISTQIPRKIERLIFVSAFIPENRGSLVDEEKKTISPSNHLKVQINEAEGAIFLHPSARIRDLFYGNCSDEDVAFANSHLQKQPLRPFLDKVTLTKENFGKVPKLYIECLQDQALLIADQRRMHSRINCDVATLDTDHSPFFSADKELAALLVR